MEDSLGAGQAPSPQTGEDAGANRRRSTRLFVAVPVVISGKDARGEQFREDTWTTVINKQGASIATSQELVPGSEIVIENPPLRIQVKARVVQFSEKSSPPGVNHAGVELLEPKNVWGIQYPPVDWRREEPNAAPVAQACVEPMRQASRIPIPHPSVDIELPSAPVLPVGEEPHVPPLPANPASVSAAKPPLQLSQLDGQVKTLLDDASLKLARMAGELEDRVQARLQETLGRLSDEQNAFAQRMSQDSAYAAGASAQLEELISRIEDASRRSREESNEARESLQEVINRALTTIPEEAGKRISQRLESSSSKYLEESRQQASAYLTDISREIKQEFGGALHTLAGERLSAAARDLDAKRAQAIGGAKELMGSAIRSSLDAFDLQIRHQSEALREAALLRQEKEAAALAAAEFENKRSEAGRMMNEQAAQIIRTNIESFKAQIEMSAEGLRGPAISTFVRQSAEKAEEEILARQTAAMERARSQIQSIVASGVSQFQAQVEQAGQQSRESALASLTQDLEARAAATFEVHHLAAGQKAENQAQAAAQAAIEKLQAQIYQATERFRGTVLPDASKEFLASFTRELKRSGETSVQRATENMQEAAQSALRGFGERLSASEQNYKEKAEEILKLPADEMSRYAEDTLVMAREQISGLRGSLVEETRVQLAVMTRGTLASMTSEAKALMEEYRSQLRDIFDALREKSACTVEACIGEAMEKGRELALRQIQKDAEDFSAVAVAQFRSHSVEAVREAAEAVNKQVGSAAFVVKDWLDQATQRLDAHLSRLEARSEAALQDIEDKSQKLSGVILGEVRKESESLMTDLRTRIQNAAGALIPSPPERPLPDRKPEEHGHEVPQHSRS
ncbi:MAG: hypothetical protein KGM47_18815 [Acidobacteriota bacterium]|nr:hypothetical protein [Acidobacteriota bacterium]